MAMNLYNNDISEYYKLISNIPLLTKEKEYELMVMASKGNKAAQNKLVESNLKFVVKIANAYKGKGLDLEDLVSEGNTGLIIAAEKVNPDKNVRFITYARWWITQSIQKALYDSGKAVRIPLNKKDEFYTDKWDAVSIYENSSSENDSVISDFISDEKLSTPEEFFLDKCDQKLFDICLESLSPEEKMIINYRYGINGYDRLMLSEIGKIMGASRETIRQKEIKIINKIRHFVMYPETIACAA